MTPTSKSAWISEELCIGCGICVKKCPFEAIQIINLPRSLTKETTHRYGPNSFKIHRLPTPRPNEVLGLVGTNGIGKSTALKVLAGKLKPNLGKYDAPPTWEEILRHFRGRFVARRVVLSWVAGITLAGWFETRSSRPLISFLFFHLGFPRLQRIAKLFRTCFGRKHQGSDQATVSSRGRCHPLVGGFSLPLMQCRCVIDSHSSSRQ